MANAIKMVISNRKKTLQDRKTELKAARTAISAELEEVEIAITSCNDSLSKADDLNPFDMCPELYNQELEPQT